LVLGCDESHGADWHRHMDNLRKEFVHIQAELNLRLMAPRQGQRLTARRR
jgi:hypothetical protein